MAQKEIVLGSSGSQTCFRTDDSQRPTIDPASLTLSTTYDSFDSLFSWSGPLGPTFFVSLSFHTGSLAPPALSPSLDILPHLKDLKEGDSRYRG